VDDAASLLPEHQVEAGDGVNLLDDWAALEWRRA